jgi:hypothetical protein
MNDSSAPLRRRTYTLLITLAVAMAVGRILATERVYEPSLHRPESTPSDPRPAWPRTRPEPMPTFSSNDRSRWATVRALVDDGTYVIGRRDHYMKERGAVLPLGASGPLQLTVLLAVGTDYRDRVRGDGGIIFEDGWQSVDKVLHPDKLEYYSSKPPLLSTLAAGEYWALKKLFGWNFQDNPWEVVRVGLLTFNVLPLILYLWLLARMAERYGATDWGRLFVVAAGCFATLVTPFLITFNNHTVAVCSTAVALYATLRIWRTGNEAAGWGWFVLAGFSAGFTVCNELPAAAFAALLGGVLLWRYPRRTLAAFAPAAALPVALLLWTNYLALGELGFAYSKFGGPWYEYEGSHWRVVPGVLKRGIDWAGRKETRAAYAFNVLLGHHGLFSLTPIFLLTVVGLGIGLRRGRAGGGAKGGGPEPLPAFLAPFTLLLSAVVIGFYLSDFVESHNYGGWTSGPRWLMWLTPLWLLTMLPAVDRLARWRWGRALAAALLALSVLSASYPAWNPWRQPWIYHWMDDHGWIPYAGPDRTP